MDIFDHAVSAKRLLMRFGNVSENIHLHGIRLNIQTICELNKIFHKNLKHLYLDDSSGIALISLILLVN